MKALSLRNEIQFIPLSKEQVKEELYPFIESEKAQLNDIDVLKGIYDDILDIDSIEIMFNSITSSIVFGFYLSNILIGYSVVIWNSQNYQSVLHLIYIEETARNRGIGQKFLNTFPIKEIDLDPANESAKYFYLKNGFTTKTMTDRAMTVKRSGKIKQQEIDDFQKLFDNYRLSLSL